MTAIEIREANINDLEWVINIMQEALEPYYDGNHGEHAKRIFFSHLNNGNDNLGFFSFEQRMFIAVANGKRVGMIHIVGKKQMTYKISPLIVVEESRHRYGIGIKLYKFAENYILSKKNIRQIYCTVAENNDLAQRFFIKMGFVKAGMSASHYKIGINENMFYKILGQESITELIDRENVSVIELDEIKFEIRDKIKEMLLIELPRSFNGIDNEWVKSLFDGYDRRDLKDVNAKYKLIYVAIDANMNPIGVAGATPKKGTPIKIMPLIAGRRSAFNALLIDLPYQLSKYGHKVYAHLNPSVEETYTLQKLGWRLDGVLPAAYNPDVVTQQWSYDITPEIIRNMRVKSSFLNSILTGEKTLEVRVGYNTIKDIVIGDYICFNNYSRSAQVKVSDIRVYKSFVDMFMKEDYKQIMPWATCKEEVLTLLQEFYTVYKEKLGVYVFEFYNEEGDSK
ncbi:MAG: GNAT family N-acetyltransferase [Mobilitalea sp.]